MVLNVSVGESSLMSSDLSVWYKTKLDKCLEAVADTQHKTVPDLSSRSCNSVLDVGGF